MYFKYRAIFLFLTLILTLQACQFDLFEKNEFVTPEISILGMETKQDTVFIIVEVIDNGRPIEVIGIAYEQGETPEITDNQQFYGGESGTFSIPVLDLEEDMNYTFVAFAGNDYTLGYSEPASFDTPALLGFIASCDLVVDEMDINGISYPMRANGTGYFLGAFRLSSSSSSIKMSFYFTEPPSRGTYTTSLEGVRELSEGNVFIVLTKDNYLDDIRAGATIYVDVDESENYIVSFCDLKWRDQGNEVTVKGLVQI